MTFDNLIDITKDIKNDGKSIRVMLVFVAFMVAAMIMMSLASILIRNNGGNAKTGLDPAALPYGATEMVAGTDKVVIIKSKIKE